MVAPVVTAVTAGIVGGALSSVPDYVPALVPIAMSVSMVPLIVAGLLLGWTGGVTAAAVGTIVVGLARGSSVMAGMYLMQDVLPVLMLLWLALRPVPGVAHPDRGRSEHWTPAGPMLVALTCVPAVVLAVIGLAFSGGPDGFQGAVRGAVERLFEFMAANMPDEGMRAVLEDPETRDPMVEAWSANLPGGVAILWAVRAALAGALAMALAQRVGTPVRPRLELAAFRLPVWYAVVFVVVLAGSLLDGDLGYLAGSVAMVLAFPFALLGFKLAHLAVRGIQASKPVLVAFYAVFVFASAVSLPGMVVVGLVEFAIDLWRGRAGGRSMEDE